MLFWIFIICLIVGFELWAYGSREYKDGVMRLGVVATVVGAVAVLASLAMIVDNYIIGYTRIEGYKQRYNSLVYQYENDLYDNDNDVGKRELMADIEYWNCDLANRKKLQRDFWVGIYYPNINDELEFIQLKDMGEQDGK